MNEDQDMPVFALGVAAGRRIGLSLAVGTPVMFVPEDWTADQALAYLVGFCEGRDRSMPIVRTTFADVEPAMFDG